MQKTEFSCKLSSTRDSDIVVTILLDQIQIFKSPVTTDGIDFSYEFEDKDDVDHTLEISMSGKTIDDTRIDENGNILEDTIVEIHDFAFDGITIDQLVYENAEYQHDFNGNGAPTLDKFFGTIGCNGTVSLKFKSPIYLWLLENM